MPATDDGFSVCMIPLSKDPQISTSAVKADLLATWPEMPPLGDTDKSDQSAVSFTVGDDAHVFLTLMLSPIPWSDLEGPCATSVLWRDAAAILRPHTAHLLVTIMFQGEPSPIEKSTLLTQVTAALVHTCDAVLGVFWCNATMVIQPKVFREFAVEVLPVGPPLHIWVDIRIGSNEQNSMSGFTAGLAALGHLEIETNNSPESPAELRERIESLIDYLLQNGPVINDGDIVGEDMNEPISAVFSPSSFGHEGTVMRLDYASTDKPKENQKKTKKRKKRKTKKKT